MLGLPAVEIAAIEPMAKRAKSAFRKVSSYAFRDHGATISKMNPI
jgi:hypothetical protein